MVNEADYQLLIHKRKSTGFKHFKYSKAFIEYSNDIDDIYENIDGFWWYDSFFLNNFFLNFFNK